MTALFPSKSNPDRATTGAIERLMPAPADAPPSPANAPRREDTLMRQIKPLSLFALVLSNTTMALALTTLFYLWIPSMEGASFGRFLLLFALTSGLVAVITVMSIAYARSIDPKYARFMGIWQEAIDLREQALSEHTIVSVAGPDGRITEVNQKFVDTFEFEPGEAIGQCPAVLYDNQHDNPAYREISEIVSNGGHWEGEQRLVSKSGRQIIVQTTIIPRFDKAGRHVDSVSIRTDLTRAREEGAQMGRNAVIERLPDGVIVYDPETFDIIYINKNGRKRLGWSNEEYSGRNMTDTFKVFDLDLFRRHLAPILTGEEKEVTIEVLHDTGPVEILTHMDEGADGRPNLISVVRDISERKEAERLKLSSVSTVSHELRTPLTSIKGALRLIESGVLGQLPAEIEKMVSVAHRNSDRLLDLVNDILSLQKLESGEMAFNLDTVNLGDLLDEAAEANAGYGEEFKVSFDVTKPDLPAYVSADATRLMQVLSNLMSNASKFSPPGGSVQLYVEDHGAAWRVCVKDDGPGIPVAARKTIFDSFFQVEDTAEHSRPGTGLGLTISKKIIQRHNGKISFDTELGKGTTFYFDLKKKPFPTAVIDNTPHSAVA